MFFTKKNSGIDYGISMITVTTYFIIKCADINKKKMKIIKRVCKYTILYTIKNTKQKKIVN